MKIKPLALGLGTGIFFALMMVVVHFYPAVSEMVFSAPHGTEMKSLFVDLYPYYGGDCWCSTVLGILFGFIDGFIFGVVVAWLYNLISGAKK